MSNASEMNSINMSSQVFPDITHLNKINKYVLYHYLTSRGNKARNSRNVKNFKSTSRARAKIPVLTSLVKSNEFENFKKYFSPREETRFESPKDLGSIRDAGSKKTLMNKYNRSIRCNK
jgi:hypothetical protein